MRNRLIQRLRELLRPNTHQPCDSTLQEFQLDPCTQSYVDSIAALPEGREGHKQLTDKFFDLYKALQPNIFCDVGANQGEVSLRAKSTCPTTAVYGYEANPEIFASRVDLMKGEGIHWSNVAVTSRAGALPIFVPTKLSRVFDGRNIVNRDHYEGKHTGKSSLLKRDENAEYDTFEVQGVTLDEQFSDLENQSFFLWIDVEGAASMVLEGAERTLDHTLAIFIEVEGHSFWKDQKTAAGVFDLLIRKGFIPLIRDREYGDYQFNAIFVRRDAAGHLDANYQNPPRVLRSGDSTKIPVLVPTFNNPTYCAQMLTQLQSHGFHDIVFLDNASTSDEMLQWLSQAEECSTVLRLGENIGPKRSIIRDDVFDRLPRHFCVTDPDILFNEALPCNFVHALMEIASDQKVGKVGMALNLADRHLFRQDDFHICGQTLKIWEWEEQFWADPIGWTPGGDRIFRAMVDTTFAVYDKYYFNPADSLNAVRVAGRFTAKHLPWYREQQLPVKEKNIYSGTQKFSYYA